ncbi:MAG: hypothetical protein Q8939_04445 [Bacteroidota bacterium]|nr:hypothetical protein [Bacteroidota bacterium]
MRSIPMGIPGSISRGPSRTPRRLSTGLAIHLIELLTDVAGGPENRDQESCNKAIQEVKKNG